MINKFKQIQIKNLDERFQNINFESKPKQGWIKIIRSALAMPLAFPANKLKVSPQSISQLEKSESEETISLKSLRQLAEAMDCEFHYAIIPHKRSLKRMIEERARIKATQLVSEVDKTMALEDQKIKNSEESIKILTKELIENLNSKLWSNDENN